MRAIVALWRSGSGFPTLWNTIADRSQKLPYATLTSISENRTERSKTKIWRESQFSFELYDSSPTLGLAKAQQISTYYETQPLNMGGKHLATRISSVIGPIEQVDRERNSTVFFQFVITFIVQSTV